MPRRKQNSPANILLRLALTVIALVVTLAAALYFGRFDVSFIAEALDVTFASSSAREPETTGFAPENTPSPTLAVNRAAPLPQSGVFNLIAIDVGQADCLLAVLPKGAVILIDAGDQDSYDAIHAYLAAAGISRIDLLVATHPHEDHIGGMQKVVENYEIGAIYMPKVAHTTAVYTDLLEAIQKKGKKIHTAIGGPMRFLELEDSVQIRVLAPLQDAYQELNDYSVVLRMAYQDTAFLLMGDAEKVSENEMLGKYADLLEADVLKVGHHGSSTSTSEAFLTAVNPSYGIISVMDGNSYNHPHKEVIARLDKHRVDYYRTDVSGVIRFTSDGEHIAVATQIGAME